MSTEHNPFQSPNAAPQFGGSAWWDVPFQSGHRRAAILVALLSALAILDAIFLGMTAVEYLSLVQQPDGSFVATGAGKKFADNIALLSMPNGVIGIVAIVAFCMWTYRVTRNLPALGGRNLKYTPGWAVGWFFIPFANLVVPYLVGAEIWRESDPAEAIASFHRKTASPLVAAWWFAYVAASVIPPTIAFVVAIRGALAASARGGAIPDKFALAAQILPSLLLNRLFGEILTLIAAILAILYVRRIDQNQEAKFDRISEQGFVA